MRWAGRALAPACIFVAVSVGVLPLRAQSSTNPEVDEAAHARLIEAAQAASQAHVRELVPAVRSILERSCAECHDPDYGRVRAGFGFILDLERLREDDYYLVPGEPEQSFIVEVLLEPEDSDLRMPPVDSDAPQLSAAEIQLVRAWVLGGAPATLEVVADRASTREAAAVPAILTAPRKGTAAKLLGTLARAHPLLVHFPIALLLVAALAEATRCFQPRLEGTAQVVGWCLYVGAPAAVAAAVSGWFNVSVQGYADETVFWHRWVGVAVAVLGVVALGLHLWSRKRPDSARWAVLGLLLLLTAGIVIAGHTGGELVHGEGYFKLF